MFQNKRDYYFLTLAVLVLNSFQTCWCFLSTTLSSSSTASYTYISGGGGANSKASTSDDYNTKLKVNPVFTMVLRSSLSDRGWDNDNFLEALSRGESAIQDANASYQKQSQARARTRDRLFQNNYGSSIPLDEENDSDDNNDKNMEERMNPPQSQPSFHQQGSQENLTSNNSIQLPDMDPTTITTNKIPDPMQAYQLQLQVWQAQMNAYVQVCQANPQAAAFLQPPPMPSMSMNGYVSAGAHSSEISSTSSPPPQPAITAIPDSNSPASSYSTTSQPSILIPPKDADPTKLNPADYIPKAKNNKDAYEVSNPADVYFAQLKRDSTIRSIARRNGDLETANAPFADAGVKALNGYLSPELIQKRREQLAQNGGEFETSRDEMILPYDASEETIDKSYTGVSYRQKLEERKRNKHS